MKVKMEFQQYPKDMKDNTSKNKGQKFILEKHGTYTFT